MNETSSNNNETCDETYDENLKPKSTIKYEENGARIKNPIIRTIYGKIVNTIKQGNRYTYEYTVDFTRNAQNINFGMLVKNQQGFSLGGSTSFVQHANSKLDAKAGDSFLVKFEFDCLLNEGVYFLNAGVLGQINEETTYLSRVSDATMFKILPMKNNKSTSMVDLI